VAPDRRRANETPAPSYANAAWQWRSKLHGKRVRVTRVDSAQGLPQYAHKFVSYMIDGRLPRGD
jgi:hypothetical protein